MSTPVPKLIRRPSRSIPSILLALVLLALGDWWFGLRFTEW